ncbi:MAG TPA: hypothetical protein PKE69_01670 [Pyrinomonadaceae bacterium]|nr:hypothetical protein [Pyrinomonadaceae bacterium]
MRKNFIIILLLSVLLSACSEKEDAPGIFSSDESEKAVDLVTEANGKLREIKQLLKENETRLEDLKSAMGKKDTAEVKKISEQLINQIGRGTNLGKEAWTKLDQAQSLNINEDFRKYLSLKSSSLLKYAEAYEERRQLAMRLYDSYDPNNADQKKVVSEEFERREEIFMKLMKDAGDLSSQAIQLAKDANNKSKK